MTLITIQFPDPQFKSKHKKRYIVTPQLIQTLAEYTDPGAILYISSDVQTVLDDMRETIRNTTTSTSTNTEEGGGGGEEEKVYFQDDVQDITRYMTDTDERFVDLKLVPTEREMSVLEKDLPVYRTLFRRTNV